MTERLAIPNLGNYTVALASAVRSLGIEAWWSTSTSAHAMELGKAVAPESLCLPFKAHLGHFIEADDLGVDSGQVEVQLTCVLGLELSGLQLHDHFPVVLRRAQAVDARHRGHDHHVPALQQ